MINSFSEQRKGNTFTAFKRSLLPIVYVYPVSLNFRISFPKLELLLNVFFIIKKVNMSVFSKTYIRRFSPASVTWLSLRKITITISRQTAQTLSVFCRKIIICTRNVARIKAAVRGRSVAFRGIHLPGPATVYPRPATRDLCRLDSHNFFQALFQLLVQ